MRSQEVIQLLVVIASFYRLEVIGSMEATPATTTTTTTPFVALSNDLIDETLKWLKFKYLCGYDPLVLQPVTQDDLNVSYSLTISEIGIQGLSHVIRLEDVEIEKYDRGSSDVGGSYSIASTLGIREVTLQFRVEVLKILSLSMVDFLANGSIPQIDIPMLALVTPAEKRLLFDSISIHNLDQLAIDLKSQNFLTTIGGWIPAVKNYITTTIKNAIRENLESRIGDAKNYLNGLLTSVVSFQVNADRCPAPSPANVTGSIAGARLPTDPTPPPPQRHQFRLTPTENQVRGIPGAFGLVIKYRSRVIGSIPTSGENDLDSTGRPTAGSFFGYFDMDRNEFVLNHKGVVYRHKNTKVDGASWPLTSTREEDSLGLYAGDDAGERKIKLNPFIARNGADDA